MFRQASVKVNGSDQEFNPMLEQVKKEYPVIGKFPFVVIRGEGPGYAETYPAWERDNPIPGQHVIEIRDKNLSPDDLRTLIAGESLHFLGGLDQNGQPIDPQFRQFKERFTNSLTDNQLAFERMQFRGDPQSVGVDDRNFEDWWESSRADAYLRGFMFSVGPENWRDQGAYTPAQEQLLGAAQNYLRGKNGANTLE